MIFLKKLPFIDTFDSMQDLVALDNLANLKKHLAAFHSWVLSDYRKEDYVQVINALFLSDPMKLVDVLPAKEKKTVTTLMGMKADEYLTWPLKEDEELMMQTLHLVISYEDDTRWHLYMPDCIRRELIRAYKADFMNRIGRISGLK